MPQAKPVLATSCQLAQLVHCKQSIEKMLVLRLAQLWYRKWEFQNICCLIQGCYVYLFICNQRLQKRSAICHELIVNCWWKMVIDFCGHWLEKASHLPAAAGTARSGTAPADPLPVPPHTTGSAITPVPPGPGAAGVHAQQGTGGHTRNEPPVTSASRLAMTFQLPAPFLLSFSCWMCTRDWQLLITCLIVRSTFSYLHLILLKEEQKSRVRNPLAFLSMSSQAQIYYSHELLW